jgi:hypothetical protein
MATIQYTIYKYLVTTGRRIKFTTMASVTGYEHAPAFDSGILQVSPLHSIYYHQYGNPDGKPGKLQ